MSGEQIEYSLIMAFGVFATLVGFGRLDIGLSDQRRRVMRKAGPVIILAGGFVLASTYLR